MMQAAMGHKKQSETVENLMQRVAAMKAAQGQTPHLVRDPMDEADLDRAGEGTESSYYDTEEESEEEQQDGQDKAKEFRSETAQETTATDASSTTDQPKPVAAAAASKPIELKPEQIIDLSGNYAEKAEELKAKALPLASDAEIAATQCPEIFVNTNFVFG